MPESWVWSWEENASQLRTERLAVLSLEPAQHFQGEPRLHALFG